MRITDVASTELFGGTRQRPLQIVRVTLVNDGPGMIRDPSAAVSVTVSGTGVVTPVPAQIGELVHGAQRTTEVGVEITASAVPGGTRLVTVVAESASGRWEAPGQLTVAEPGWTMWMVSHFHYDPVWWNTQGRFTQTWPLLPAEDGSMPEVRTVFELVRLHLAEARSDPDYKFVLAELDYLKPYFDVYPEDRADLRAFIAAGRIEIVGGSYNEPNTNLTCAESTIRNAVYGLGYQRAVIGADPTTTWMLDAFGFDPSYPGLMAAAGMKESSWARGPFHQWGPGKSAGGNRQMQFPSEFEWLSPDGGSLLTSYMPNHYSAGWITEQATDLATAEADALNQFRQLAPVAATRNVLLPVGGDHVVPARWATEIHRDWNARYVWPRFVTAIPAEYFAAVRAESAATGAWIMPQTRDMNPVYPGKDVTYIDTKQAQRDAELALLDAERLGTAAWLAGAPYPLASLDKAWRLMAFGAHHDAITGTEGDQVYLDLLAGWREAFERGDSARREAASHLAALADTATAAAGVPGADRAVVVFNTVAWTRSALARAELRLDQGDAADLRLSDDSGSAVPFLAEGVSRHGDGSLATVTLTFLATDVPGVGYRSYLVTPANDDGGLVAGSGWTAQAGVSAANETFTATADPARGGALSSITDLRSGTELLARLGNELVLAEEYPSHPRWGEGPWLLCPTGESRSSADGPATVRAERSPIGTRLVTEFRLADQAVSSETLLWKGISLIEFRTHVDGSIGQDRLLRARFAVEVPGGLPVYQTGLSVIGRPLGPTDLDVAEHTFTLDNPAHEWFGVGSTVRVAITAPNGERRVRAIGVAEVIVPSGPATDPFPPRDPVSGRGARQAVRELLIALAREGVTATCSVPEGPRYGWIELDSNLPDVRITIGDRAENAFTAAVLRTADPAIGADFDRQLKETGAARAWVPGRSSHEQAFGPAADVRGAADLPVLVVAGQDLDGQLAALIDDLADAEIEVTGPAASLDGGLRARDEPSLAGHAVALFNRGLPGSIVTPAGEASIALMRACSSWPCGVWLDGEQRTVPDGSSFALQHWSHTFEYAFAAGARDWRGAGFPLAGQEYSHRLLALPAGLHPGPLPATQSLVSVTPAGTDLMTWKPRGNPLAPVGQPDRADGVTVRLRGLTGSAAQATIRLFTGATAASVTDLLEEAEAESNDLGGGAVAVHVPAVGTVTLAVDPGQLAPLSPVPAAGTAGRPAPGGPPPIAEAVPEPAQPVFTRYWLHGKGPAPAGNLPVTVHLSPGLAAPAPGESTAIRLTVAGGPVAASGTVTLGVPSGLRLMSLRPAAPGEAGLTAGRGPAAAPGQVPPGPLHYRLGPDGYAAWDLVIQVPASAPSARHFVTATIIDDAGQLLEDAVVIAVGELSPASSPALAELTLSELAAQAEAASLAEAAEAELISVTGDLAVPPGGQAELVVRLLNHTASQLHGEAQLISSHGSWSATGPWTTGVTVAPGDSAALSFSVDVPPDARPGEQWWALVKVMYFGRLRYSVPAWITVVSAT